MSDLPPKASELIDAARNEERIGADRKAAIRRSLQRALPAGALASSTAAAAVSATTKSVTAAVLTKLVVGVVATVAVGTLATVGWKTTHRPAPTLTVAIAPQGAPPPAVPLAVAQPADAEEEEDDDDSTAGADSNPTSGLPEIPLAPHATPPRHIPRANKHRPPHAKKVIDPMPPPLMAPAPAQPTPHVCSVADELALLKPAQLAIGDGRADKALQLLAAHRHECPTGTLAEEREAAWVLALCAAHEDDEALRAAQQFVHANPHSPHLDRLRSSCVGQALKR